MSRQLETRGTGLITGTASVNLMDAHVCLNSKLGQKNAIQKQLNQSADSDAATEFLSLEEAMDLSLLMPYNPVNMKERRTLNPYLFFNEQQQARNPDRMAEFI